MSQPAISVAMSVYNGGPYLGLAIESILSQSFADFEFLILNDGSTDASGEIIDRYAAQDSRIRAIHRENEGLITSLNQLVEEARAPIIARMDSDDIALPHRFETQFAFLKANPDHGVVSSWTIDIDADGTVFRLRDGDQPTSYEAFRTAIRNGGQLLCHPSSMFRRDLVLAIGGYHSAFRHCEDYDLWLRLSTKCKLTSLPVRLLQYRHTEGQISNKHLIEQQIGVAASRLAHREREAGRPDPTETLATLPPLEAFDRLFGREGATAEARAITVKAILYSSVALGGQGFDLILDHVRNDKHVPGLARAVLRLLRLGMPHRALRLATALMKGTRPVITS